MTELHRHFFPSANPVIQRACQDYKPDVVAVDPVMADMVTIPEPATEKGFKLARDLDAIDLGFLLIDAALQFNFLDFTHGANGPRKNSDSLHSTVNGVRDLYRQNLSKSPSLKDMTKYVGKELRAQGYTHLDERLYVLSLLAQTPLKTYEAWYQTSLATNGMGAARHLQPLWVGDSSKAKFVGMKPNVHDPYLKKEQLAVAAIYRRINRPFDDSFTAMADYQLPRVLCHLGVLRYSNELLFGYPSIDEATENAVRAATVLAVRRIARNNRVSDMHVDFELFNMRSYVKDVPYFYYGLQNHVFY